MKLYNYPIKKIYPILVILAALLISVLTYAVLVKIEYGKIAKNLKNEIHIQGSEFQGIINDNLQKEDYKKCEQIKIDIIKVENKLNKFK